jgi:hypothetical protein
LGGRVDVYQDHLTEEGRDPPPELGSFLFFPLTNGVQGKFVGAAHGCYNKEPDES